MIAEYHGAVGVQVTSSHMPLNFNGFKFIYPEGNSFVNEDLDELKELFREEDFSNGIGELRETEEIAHEIYAEKTVSFFMEYFDRIDRRVVLDTMGGAANEFLPDLMDQLGADLVDMSDEKPQIDPPDPVPEKLEHVKEKVDDEAEIGVATDMDADRVAVYYNDRWLDGNEIFGVLLQILEPKTTVASIDTSRMVEELADQIHFTRVGDPFVLDRMVETGAKLSGEPNGHYCFNKFVPYNSGIMAALLIAASDLDSLIDNLPEYVNARRNVEVDDKSDAMEGLVKAVKAEYKVLSEIDGVKFRVDDTLVLARSSGSSNKIRFIADAKTVDEAEAALDRAESLLRNA
jgi:phosphoglucosamine mutase